MHAAKSSRSLSLKSVSDVRGAEIQDAGLLLSDTARVYAKESVSSDAAVRGARRYKTEYRRGGWRRVPRVFKQAGLSAHQVALFEACM